MWFRVPAPKPKKYDVPRTTQISGPLRNRKRCQAVRGVLQDRAMQTTISRCAGCNKGSSFLSGAAGLAGPVSRNAPKRPPLPAALPFLGVETLVTSVISAGVVAVLLCDSSNSTTPVSLGFCFLRLAGMLWPLSLLKSVCSLFCFCRTAQKRAAPAAMVLATSPARV